jgi:predicted DsbA family dithiol-disulfide isomerase
MKVEIWSDILCPWCYIGKREFENALNRFKHKDKVEVTWKSFELDPSAQKDYDGDLYSLLSSKYNVSIERARQMTGALIERAKATGLTYNMDIAKATNSFDAHRLIHLAAEHGLQETVIERLSAAYLTEGKHIGHHETLIQIGVEAGLDEADVTKMLNSNSYADAVRKDEYEAQNLRIKGVPFFLINQKYSISGAQPQEVFAEALEKIWEELYPETKADVTSGNAQCGADGQCQ